MLDEKEIPVVPDSRPLGDDGLPVIELDEAYYRRTAEHVREMIGEYPIWFTGTREEIAQSRVEAVESFARELERQGIVLPDVPLEALRREHLYEDRW